MSEVGKTANTADRALLKAFRVWGMEEFDRSLGRFSESWRDRLRSAWESASEPSPNEAKTALCRDHGASARPDPHRVHPSWFVRALRAESEAVKRAVTAQVHPSLRPSLIRGLGLTPDELTPDVTPDSDALSWVLSLWAERLVGALPEEDDPPVIVALTRLGSLDLARLIKTCGVAKHAFAMEFTRNAPIDDSVARFTPIDRVRLGFFRRRLGVPDPRLGPLARQDLRYFEGDRRRAHARLGLVTIGRLLDSAEDDRARWAVQHLPYSVAKLVRRKMSLPIPERAVFAWETWILEAAWSRLLSEGRMTGGRDWLPDLEEGEDS